MKVVLLGDSIREQYGPKVKELLGDSFDVWYPDENCRFSQYMLRMLFDYAGMIADADIVHLNCGHWDLCDLWGDGTFTPIDVYVGQMMRILDVLQKQGKTVIFATTTPVRDENPFNRNADIQRFNAVVVEQFKARGVRINDLNALLDADIYRYISEDNIHLSEEGIELCAAQVAQNIRDIIPYLSDKQAEMRTENDAPVVDGAPILI